jgi:hypothetical protein
VKRVLFAATVTFVAVSALAVSTQAQTRRPPASPARGPSAPHLDLSVGSGLFTGSDLGSADADLRGSTGGPFQLFATKSRIAASVPLEARVGFRLSPRYVLEVRGAWARPELRASIAADVEGAPALTVVEKVDLYSLDLGVLVMFSRSRARAVTPFISAGGGYVAAVHEGLTLLEGGYSYRGGGGVKYPLAVRSAGRIKGVGIRADGAVVVLNSGLVSGSGPTPQIAASAALYLMF